MSSYNTASRGLEARNVSRSTRPSLGYKAKKIRPRTASSEGSVEEENRPPLTANAVDSPMRVERTKATIEEQALQYGQTVIPANLNYGELQSQVLAAEMQVMQSKKRNKERIWNRFRLKDDAQEKDIDLNELWRAERAKQKAEEQKAEEQKMESSPRVVTPPIVPRNTCQDVLPVLPISPENDRCSNEVAFLLGRAKKLPKRLEKIKHYAMVEDNADQDCAKLKEEHLELRMDLMAWW